MTKYILLIFLLLASTATAQTTRFLWWPSEGLPALYEYAGQNVANRLQCTRKETLLGITNATKIGFLVGASTPSASTVVGFAIYDEDGTQIVKIAHQETTWTSSTAYLESSLTPFSISPGSWTYTCWCTSNTSGTYANYGSLAGSVMSNLWNANSAALLAGYADENCDTGDPPNSITPDSLNARAAGDPNPLLVILGTDTP